MESAPRSNLRLGRSRKLVIVGWTVGLGVTLLVLSGCETLRGAGRDLQSAGDRMSNIVNKVNFLW
jgi:predicted small secreted protein